MNKQQSRQVTMMSTVIAHLESKPTVWQASPLIAEEFTSLKSVVNTILSEEYNQVQRNPKGLTKVKNGQLDFMCNLTVQLIAKIRPYARRTKNMVLLQAIDYSYTGLRRPKGASSVSRCQLVLDKAKEHLSDLGIYNVSQAQLDELQAAIDKYKPLVAHRNTVGDARATATTNISTLMGQAKIHLLNLDDLIPSQLSESDFISTYKQCKKITNSRTRKTKPPEVPAAV